MATLLHGVPSQRVLRRVAVFIDGGYLRKGFKNGYGSDDINFALLRDELTRLVGGHTIRPELERAYFYDANVDIGGSRKQPKDSLAKHREISRYLSRIKKEDFYQVRVGRLIRTGSGNYRQKGVDVLLAIDMITKAYHDQYDAAVLVAGDDDLVDAVETVKEMGKSVYGVYFEDSMSDSLRDSLDVRVPVGSDRLPTPERFLGTESGAAHK